MGRIKSKIVKRTSKTLLNEENSLFTDRFEDNKKVLGRLMPSKKVRNQIAGYIARIKKMGQYSKEFESATRSELAINKVKTE